MLADWMINMKKYIIKNCPIYRSKCHECYKYCHSCVDCLLKQIVEKCKSRVENDICLNCKDFETQKQCWECDYEHHRQEISENAASLYFAKQILDILEIEEVNE